MSGIIKVRTKTEGNIFLFYGCLQSSIDANINDKEAISFASGVINNLRSSLRDYGIVIEETTSMHRDLVEAILTGRMNVTDPTSFVFGWICSKVSFE